MTWKLTTTVLILCMISRSYAQEGGIINNADSPHVKLKSINIGDCRWTSGFWADKFKLCEEVMVPHMGTLLKGDVGHAYNNFKIVAGLKEGKHQGTHWHDGDFYKWMEAASYVCGVEAEAGGYATIKRAWKTGDVVTLDMPLETRLLTGHPRIEEVRNQAAIKRGPVVYCIETPDLPENTDILDVYLPSDIELKVSNQPDFLGGVTTLRGKVLLRDDQKGSMYATLRKPDWEKVETQFVPYFAWSNRGKSEMTVWLPIVWE